MLTSIIIYFLLAGCLTGLLAGLFGIGGSIIIVPILAELFFQLNFPEPLIMHMAIATSLAIMIFTSSVSTIRHYHLNGIDWQVVKILAPGLVVGSFCGAQIADFFNTEVLQSLFAGFLILVAMNIAYTFHRGSSHLVNTDTPTLKKNVCAGLLIGVVAGILGISGAVLTIPWLIHANYNLRTIPACSSACAFVIAISGSLSAFLAGLDEAQLPAHSLSYIYLPAVLCVAVTSLVTTPIGVHFSYRLPPKVVGYSFAVFLLAVATRLFMS